MFILILLLVLKISYANEVVLSPKEIIGFSIGDDYKLASYNEAVNYFKVLEKISNRVKIYNAGKTSYGNDMLYLVITAKENIEEIDGYAEISKKLTLAEVSEEEARKLSQIGKVIVYIDGGLHADECAPAQHIIQLSYLLASSEREDIRFILDNAIVLLFLPNPDGMEMIAKWYNKNIGTPFEISPMPWLYNKYVGHDNNRDFIMAHQIETRNILKLINQKWYPEVVYNHHQTAPFPARIWIPPNSEPTNPNVHSLIIRWQNLIGSYMGAVFDSEGKEGAISRFLFDTWYPGYLTQVMDSHNIISVLTETALYRYATPRFYTVKDFPEDYKDFILSAFYPKPWKGGWWRLRDAVEYCQTASLAVLQIAAKNKTELLYNKYKMAKDTIDRFSKEPIYAYIIPENQYDKGALYELFDILQLQGIEIKKSLQAFRVDEVNYPAGTYIIFLSQPFGLFVKNIFEIQRYPDLRKYPELWQSIVEPKKINGAPIRAYDVSGWTIPLQMGIKVTEAYSPVEASTELLSAIDKPKTSFIGEGNFGLIMERKYNNSYIAVNRLVKKGFKLSYLTEKTKVRNYDIEKGAFQITGGNLSIGELKTLLEDLSLTIYRIDKPIKNVKTKPISYPRIGVYKSWVKNIDEGWTRWLLDKYEFPNASMYNADIKAGDLNQRYDVLILPPDDIDTMLNGYKVGMVPPDYVGGIDEIGIDNLKRFVNEGGKIIALDQASDFAIEKLSVPAKNILKDKSAEEFECAGSLLKIHFSNWHPIAFGMLEEGLAFFDNSPAFIILPSRETSVRSIAYYPDENLLLSGYINGQELLKNKSAIIEASIGEGKVILIGFSVNHRGQSRANFKLLFNAILGE